ncbi:hypothetical protein [Maribacter sp. 2307ULW6-5]|uniref:hypothetical protein n=1 Tax=Maribacter sp. 2307ULW6-5 TaxID=3386275 RepID=UPI0039BC62CD
MKTKCTRRIRNPRSVKIMKKVALALLPLLLLGCGLAQTDYERNYNALWRQIVKSKAWEDALRASRENRPDVLYAGLEENGALPETPRASPSLVGFYKTYDALVSRAYFRILSDAEKADARLEANYLLTQDRLKAAGPNNRKALKKEQETASQQFKAHRAMLNGLKSWNLFGGHRSGDLAYFKAENQAAIEKMMLAGASNEKMVLFLIYKLADLYHLEE